jgi:lycopene beta-cyclase
MPMSAEMAADASGQYPPTDFEIVLVGGGLQNGLIALAALHAQPDRRIALVEAEGALGGNHTWSLHGADVPVAARAFIEPLLVARWDGYEVSFPGYARGVGSEYAVISSERFDRVVQAKLRAAPECRLILGRRAQRIGEREVELSDGSRITGELVIDARGPDPSAQATTGYQKFLGRELRTERPHGLARPILMDANVEQRGGYRFFYVLPLAPDRLLVEDTCFSRSAEQDLPLAREAIDAYARRFGTVAECVREECGVLPMPWSSHAQLRAGSPLRGGYRGGFFHPATGYSLPVALRLALHVASHPIADMFGTDFAGLVRRHHSQARYAGELNRMLFHCFADDQMWNVFARFYRLSDRLIERFYALDLTPWDRARIVLGRPPRGFSLTHALTSSSARTA